MRAPRRCSLPSTCSCIRDKSRSYRFHRRIVPLVADAYFSRDLLWDCACSVRRIGDDIAVLFTPFRIFIQSFGGIEKVQGSTLRQRPCVRTSRKEIASKQDVLPIGKHELEKQDRGIRMRGAAGDTGAFEACHAGWNDEPVDRRAAFAQLLGLVGVGGERERNFTRDYEVRQQGMTLAYR